MTPIDENAAVIEPRRGKREEPLPSSAILIFTSQDLEHFLRCLPRAPRRSHRVYLTDIYTCSYKDTPIALAGPMLGAPQAVMVLERLIALGVKEVVAVGWCGSLQPDVRIGDVVLPLGAISEEGTSAHYPSPGGPPGPSPELLAPLRTALREQSIQTHEGKVWSTDAPFRETVGKVCAYQAQGVLAVEMEVSALFAAARFRSIRLAAALVVSDDLSTLQWVHGFRDLGFKKNREKLAELTLDVVCSSIRSLSTE